MSYAILDAMQVPEVTLHVYPGQDLSFDVVWWADEAKTQMVTLSEAAGQVRDEEGQLLIDLAPTVADNRAVIRVPSAQLSGLAETGSARWDLEVTAAVSGQRKTLVRGPVRIWKEVTQ